MSRFRGNPRFGGPGPGGPPRHLMRGGGPPRGGRGGFQQHRDRQPMNLMGGPGPRGPPRDNGPGPRGPPRDRGHDGPRGPSRDRGGFQNNNFRGRVNFRGGNNRGPMNSSPSSSNIRTESKDKSEVQEFPVPAVKPAVKDEPKAVEEQPKKAVEPKKDELMDTAESSKPAPAPEAPAEVVPAPEPEVTKPDPVAEESVPHLTEVYISEYLCDLYLDVDKDGVTGIPKSTAGFDCLWASLRATHGVSGGKIAFEVLALENTTSSTEQNACVLRVGWSHDEIDISLGENGSSWGYGGTAKKSHDNKYLNYGDKFGAGDSITCYVDLESDEKTISFAKNGKHQGAAFTLTPDNLKKPLFPSVSSKNVKFLLNFGQQPTKHPLADGYKMIAFTAADHVHPCVAGPATLADAEFIMMVGLPAAGKSTWCESHAAAHPDKRYNILGTNLIMEKMKVTGLHRKRNYHGRWEELIQKATGILNTLFKIVEQKLERFPRNIILDQTNVYESARRRKLRNFSKFGRKVAVIIVNAGEELTKRNAIREKEEGKFVPESAVMEMKANFRIPALTEGLTEVQFIEMDESATKKQIDEFQAEGKKYKERGSRSESEKAKPGEKRMSEKPPFEDKLNKRSKPDNEPSRSDGGRHPSSSRDRSNDGDRSRQDRPNRSFEDRRRDSDRRDRDDKDRRVERGGSSRGGFSVTVDRREDNRRRSAEKARSTSGDRGGDRGSRDQGGRMGRNNDRDSRGDSGRGRDDRRGGGGRFGSRDADNKDEGGFNRDRGGFRGGNDRGRDFGRGDTRGGRDDRSGFGGNQSNNRPSRFSDRNPPAPTPSQDTKPGGWNQRGPEHQPNQYGAGAPQPNNQFGGSRDRGGSSFGGNQNDSFNKPPVKTEPMDIGRPAGNQYPPNNTNRNYPPVKSESRDHDNTSQHSNKSFGSTMIDYNTPETKQYGVPQDNSNNISNRDQYGQQSAGGNSSFNQQRPRFGEQGPGSGTQQYGGFNNNKSQPSGGFGQSGGPGNQQSTGSSQQSRDSGKFNQGGSSYNQSGRGGGGGSGDGGPSSSQPGSYDLSQIGKLFNPPAQAPAPPPGPVGAPAGFDRVGNSGAANKPPGRSADLGAPNQYNQQQTSNYGSGQYNSQPPFVQDQKPSYGAGNQRQSYGERQSYSDPLARDLVRVTSPAMEEIRDKAMKTYRNKNTAMFQNHPAMEKLRDRVPSITRDRAMVMTTNRVMEAIQVKVTVKVLDQAMVSLQNQPMETFRNLITEVRQPKIMETHQPKTTEKHRGKTMEIHRDKAMETAKDLDTETTNHDLDTVKRQDNPKETTTDKVTETATVVDHKLKRRTRGLDPMVSNLLISPTTPGTILRPNMVGFQLTLRISKKVFPKYSRTMAAS
ncbi:heterogeneous nuclear ribonucleoprotein U-like protein 1 isoform X2 [Bolinopsis microptera]|uniref:heterogeneous nuclear ribonucleoprotein U-like protein 1 isoform X2 n=1 Tax=Bolinopsis microptera TaxID=2820187 RepID=UPI003078E62C